MMFDKMLDLQKELDANNISEFQLYSYENFTLKIIGSFDFAYYHNVEITFYEVSYISCETHFRSAQLRLASDDDLKELFLRRTPKQLNKEKEYYKTNSIIDEENDSSFVICIPIFENLDKENCVKYFIEATNFDYKFENVLYYDKED